MTLTDTWTLSSGKLVTASATLSDTADVFCDGHRTTVPSTPTITVVIEIAGVGPQFGGVRALSAGERSRLPASHAHVTHSCGKLGMSAEQAAKVAALVAQLKDAPVWQAHVARGRKNRDECAAYEAAKARMARVMGY